MTRRQANLLARFVFLVAAAYLVGEAFEHRYALTRSAMMEANAMRAYDIPPVDAVIAWGTLGIQRTVWAFGATIAWGLVLAGALALAGGGRLWHGVLAAAVLAYAASGFEAVAWLSQGFAEHALGVARGGLVPPAPETNWLVDALEEALGLGRATAQTVRGVVEVAGAGATAVAALMLLVASLRGDVGGGAGRRAQGEVQAA